MFDLPLNDFPNETWQNRWESLGGRDAILGRVRRIQIAEDFINDYVPAERRGKRLMWVGCSWGEPLEVLREFGADVVGVEPSPTGKNAMLLAMHWERQQLRAFFSDGIDFCKVSTDGIYDGIVIYAYSALLAEHVQGMRWTVSDGVLTKQTRRLLSGCVSMLTGSGYLLLKLPTYTNSSAYESIVYKQMIDLKMHADLISPGVHRWQRREVREPVSLLVDSVSSDLVADTGPSLPSLPADELSVTPDNAEVLPEEDKTNDPPSAERTRPPETAPDSG